MCSFFRNLLTIVVLTLVIFPQNILQAQSTLPSVISVETYAGTMSSSGFANGTRLSARFSDPIDLVYDDAGNLFIVEEDGCAIRKIDTNGQVTTFAGLPGTRGFADGTGTSARFNDPRGIAFDHEGNLIVADKDNHKIRKITPAGVVTTIAGSSQGFKNGSGTEAQFYKPVDVAIDDNGNIYVADGLNYSIRKIDPEGNVTTVTGTGSQGYQDGDFSVGSMDIPQEIELDADGNLLVIATYALRKLDFSQETISTIVGDGTGDVFTDAGLGRGNGLLIDKDETIYLVSLHSVSRVNTDNSLTLLAGNMVQGVANGDPLTARLHFPKGITRTPEGDFLIGDKANHVIRRLVLDRPPEVLSIKRQNPATETANITEATFRITFSEAVSGVNFADFEIKAGGSQGTIASVSWVTATTAYDVQVTDISGSGILDLDLTEQNNIADAAGKTLLSLIPEEEESYQIDSNQNPVFSSVPPTRVWEGESYEYVVSVFDNDGDAVSVTAPILPAWLSLQEDPGGLVSTFAGSGNDFYADGVGTNAGFRRPRYLAMDSDGNIYVSDGGNRRIRKISPEGVVSHFAGKGEGYSRDGNAFQSDFWGISGLDFDSKGNLFVGDVSAVRMISPEGEVTTFAGALNTAGYSDGTGTEARFSNLYGLAIDSQDNIYVIDGGNRIRKINPEGVVTTLAGSGTQSFADGTGTNASFRIALDLTIDDDDNIIVADTYNHRIRSITPEGVVTTILGSGNEADSDGTGTSASFNKPGYITFEKGYLYISSGGHAIRKVDNESVVTTLAGNGTKGFVNGRGTSASFDNPGGLVIGSAGNVFLTDIENHVIRKISGPGNIVTGDATGQSGSHSVQLLANDGNGGTAEQSFEILINPTGQPRFTSSPLLTIDEEEAYLYLPDAEANGSGAISYSAPVLPEWLNLEKHCEGVVTTIAGLGYWSGQDGTGRNAGFSIPYGITIDASENLYVVERYGHRIRKINPEGVVTTLAGSASSGYQDGTGANAMFDNPRGITVDASGNLYVTDTENHVIRKITPEGVVTTLAGTGTSGFAEGTGTNAAFNWPRGIAIDSEGNLYIADSSNQRIRKVTPDGIVSTIVGDEYALTRDGTGTDALLNRPHGLTIDAYGNLYFTDISDNLIRKISTDHVVTTLAGSGEQGYQDGTAMEASFSHPAELAVDHEGNIFVTDRFNNRIRKISPDGMVSTIAGSGQSTSGDGTGTEASFYSPLGIVMDAAGNLYVNDSFRSYIRKVSFPLTGLSGDPLGKLGEHNVTLRASGNDLEPVDQSFTISVVDVTPPEFISGLNVDFVSGNFGPAYLAEATDRNPVSFLLGTNNDEASFVIDASSGRLSFVSPPDHLNPTDKNLDNVYTAEVIASDGPNQTSQLIDIQVLAETTNMAPFFTSQPVTQVWENRTYSYFPAFSDKDGDDVSVTATTIPSWLSLTIDAGGEVSTVAGSGQFTSKDGTGTDAGFGNLRSMAIDVYNNIYIIDNNSGLRKITPEGVVTTLVGGGSSGQGVGTGTEVEFESLGGMVVDKHQNIYLAADYSVKKITPEGIVSNFVGSGVEGNSNGTGTEAAFSSIGYLVFDKFGNLYLTDTYNNVVRKITPDRVVTTFAGSGDATHADGVGEAASFYWPSGITIDGEGNLFIADKINRRIRRVSPQQEVSTVAGSGAYTYKDGTGTEASFRTVEAITIDKDNNLYVSDENTLRKITSQGVVTTYAGNQEPGYIDGERLEARFSYIVGVQFDRAGNLFVADGGNSRIRKIRGESYNLTGSPVGQVGAHEVTLTALDGKGGAVDQSFTLNIIEASDPIFTSSPELLAGQNLDYSYEIKTQSPSEENTGITLVKKPDWLSLDYLPSAMVDTYVGYGGSVVSSDNTQSVSLNSPLGLTVDESNNLYIVDAQNHRIRKVSPEGIISDLAGFGTTYSDGAYADGTGSDARFNIPVDVVVDSSGNLYVTDSGNHAIRKITQQGVVTTLAGSGEAGFQEGTGTEAAFNTPVGIAIDSENNLYVTDRSNSRIRKITPEGVVSTLTGMAGHGYQDGSLEEAKFTLLGLITSDKDDNLYVSGLSSTRIRKISATGIVSTIAGSSFGFQDGEATSAQFGQPSDLAVDQNGNIFVTDLSNYRVRVITPEGIVKTVAGNGISDWLDGKGTNASFNRPYGIAAGPDGTLYISDSQSDRVRKISFPYPVLFGNPGGSLSIYDVELKATASGGGEATQSFTITVQDLTPPEFLSSARASFRESTEGVAYQANATDVREISYGLGTAGDEALFSIDPASGEISFLVSPDFESPADANSDNDYLVKVIATDGDNESELLVTISVTDGREGELSFTSTPVTTVRDNETYVYDITTNDPDQSAITIDAPTLPDWLNLSTEESGRVTTYAGSVFGYRDGDLGTARFTNPGGIAVDSKGNIYVSEPRFHRVRKVSHDGIVTTLAGSGREGFGDGLGKSAHFNAPSAMAMGPDGNVYVTDIGNNRIRKITPEGRVTTYAGSGQRGFTDGNSGEASFFSPQGLAFDNSGNLYVSDRGNHAIRKISDDGVVTTIAGTGGQGSADGTGTNASFNSPYGLEVDNEGNIYVADYSNQLIRKIDTEGVVSTLAGSGRYDSIDGQGTFASFKAPRDIILGPDNNLYVSDYYGYKIRLVTLSGRVTTFAGTGTSEVVEGDLSTVSFKSPGELAFDRFGNMFIADFNAYHIRRISAGGSRLTGKPGANVGEHSVRLTGVDEFGSAEQTFTISVQSVSPEVISFLRKSPVSEDIHTRNATFEVTFNKEVVNVGERDFELNSSGGSGNVLWMSKLDARTYEVNLSSLSTGLIDLDLKAQNDIVDLSGLPLSSLVPTDVEETYTNRNQSPAITSDPVLEVRETEVYQYAIEVSDPDTDPVLTGESILPDWLSIEGDRPGYVTVVAGSGNYAHLDGTGTDASFLGPGSLIMDDLGNLYLSDEFYNVIKKITPDGVVTTIAGSGNYGFTDGVGTAASFARPRGLALTEDGNIIVADVDNHVLRLVTPDGVVSTFAGSGNSASIDGTGTGASFQSPRAIVLSPNGNLYVGSGNRIREVTPDGVVTTFVGSGQNAVEDGTGLNASFGGVNGLTVDNEGNLFVASAGSHTIRKVTSDGVVTTVAGNGTPGFADGQGTEATFHYPDGIHVSSNGDLFVADSENHLIRKVDNQGQVSTYAGDGTASSSWYGQDARYASFHVPTGITGDARGNLFVAEKYGRRIRKISVGELLLTGDPSGKVGDHQVRLQFKDDFGALAEQAFTISVVDATAPLFTSATEVKFLSGNTGPAYKAEVSDPSPVTFSLGTDHDETLFSLNAITGSLSFVSPPDFQNPIDENTDNVYQVRIIADDGEKQASILVSIQVVNATDNIAPDFVSKPVTRVFDGKTYHYPIMVSDRDGDIVSVTAATLPSWLSLERSSGGVVTTFAGSGIAVPALGTGTEAGFGQLSGIAVDKEDNLYVSDITSGFVRKISPSGVVTNLAGGGTGNDKTGPGDIVNFQYLGGLTVDDDQNVFVVADYSIKKITPEGVVSDFAGTGTEGDANGTGTEAAFGLTGSLARDESGNLYFADVYNHVIRKITPEAGVTTLAGSGQGSFADGSGTAASFNLPVDIAIDNSGYLYVADRLNRKIRKISPDGEVNTLAGSGGYGTQNGPAVNATFIDVLGVTVDKQHNVYVADRSMVRKITSEGDVSTYAGTDTDGFRNGERLNALFGYLAGLQVDNHGDLFVADVGNNRIRKISGEGYVLKGDATGKTGEHAVVLTAFDGEGGESHQAFNINVVDTGNPLFLSDPVLEAALGQEYRYEVRVASESGEAVSVEAVELPSWLELDYAHSALVQTYVGTRGSVVLAQADYHNQRQSLASPNGVVVDKEGNLFIVSTGSQKIIKVSPEGLSETLAGAGSQFGDGDYVDGQGTDARFNDPMDITLDSQGNLYVTDGQNYVIRKITPDGQVTTLAGNGLFGSADGTGTEASFGWVGDIDIDSQDNLYVTHINQSIIRKITPEGVVSTFYKSITGGTQDGPLSEARFYGIRHLAIDNDDNIFVSGSSTIRKISNQGIVSTFAGGQYGFADGQGTNAKFAGINGLEVDDKGNVFVSDLYNHMIRMVTPGGMVSTVAGTGSPAFTDGPGNLASFQNPSGIAIGVSGEVFISDNRNQSVRKLTFPNAVLLGNPGDTPGTYDVELKAITESGGEASQSFTIVTKDLTAPVFTSPGKVSFREMTTGVAYTAVATDLSPVSYRLGSELDESFFSIDSSSGEVSFLVSPDFETPLDANTDNDYLITVVATDGINESDFTVTISVTDARDIDLEFTSLPITSIKDTEYYSYQVTLNDPDQSAIDIQATKLPEWMKLTTEVQGQVTTYAGTRFGGANGPVATAQFAHVAGVAVDSRGYVYVAQDQGDNIRVISPDGIVSTFAGSGKRGFQDGVGLSAHFNWPRDLAVDAEDNLYVADYENHRIRKITPEGIVSTYAGSGIRGLKDGTAQEAQLNYPSNIVFDASGNLYFTDAGNAAVRKVSPDGVVSTVAGNGQFGSVNGPGSLATFSLLRGIALDNEGNIYIADNGNRLLRKLDKNGFVTTVAGRRFASYPALDGSGTLATFHTMRDMAMGPDGYLYLLDQHKVRKISTTGVVSTFTGGDGTGDTDGALNEASFSYVNGITFDKYGNIFIAENGNSKVRKISAGGTVISGKPAGYTGDYEVELLASDEFGSAMQEFTVNIETSSPELLQILRQSHSSERIHSHSATFRLIFNKAVKNVDKSDFELYASDYAEINWVSEVSSHVYDVYVSRLGPGSVNLDLAASHNITDLLNTPLVGLLPSGTEEGFINENTPPQVSSSPVTEVREDELYSYPVKIEDMELDRISDGDHVIPDWLSLSGDKPGYVTSYAGTGTAGFVNGSSDEALFNTIIEMAIDDEGNLFVADAANNVIRKVTPDGLVSTFAGSGARTLEDGIGTNASFGYPSGLAFDQSGNLIVADAGNHAIRKITPDGVVSTIAGSGSSGSANGQGTLAGFNFPSAVLVASDGNIYVSDLSNHLIRKIDNTGMVSTLAGSGFSRSENGTGTQASFASPRGLAMDGDGNLFVAEEYGHKIRKITPEGVVSTFAGTGGTGFSDGYGESASFQNPVGLYLDKSGNLIVTDSENALIRQITPEGLVSTIAGGFGRSSVGYGQEALYASFGVPIGIIGDNKGNLYVTERWGHRIRKISGGELMLQGNPANHIGDHNVTLKFYDEFGGLAEQTFTITVTGLEPPAKPVITGISQDTGASDSDGVTNDRNITISGTAEPNITVAVSSQYGPIRSTQADNNGDWLLDITDIDLFEIKVDLTAEAIDASGTRSEKSDVFVLTPDFTAPLKPVITNISDDTGASNSDGITNDKNIKISGTAEPEAKVEVFTQYGPVRSTQADVNGDWVLDITDIDLFEIKVNLTAEAVDLAGNRSERSDAFVLTPDFTAPDKPVITGISDDTGISNTDGVTNDRNIIISGTAEPKAKVEVFTQYGPVRSTQSDANGDWLLDIRDINLFEIKVNLTAEAVDLAGNRSEKSDVFVLTPDFTAPVKPVITGISDDTGASDTDGVTKDKNITISGTAEPNVGIEVFTQYGPISGTRADANGNWLLDISGITLIELKVSLTAIAVDIAGNRSERSDEFMLTPDFTPPVRPVITGISEDTGSSDGDGITNDKHITISGTSEPNARVDIFTQYGPLRSTQADVNGDWLLDITDISLIELVINLTAEAVDLAGNGSRRSEVFVLTPDFTSPGVTIDIQKTSADGFTIMALFDEAVNGLTADGILVTGGTASDVIRHDAMSYSFVVSLSGSTADVSINANSVEDLAGNGNTVSNQLTLNLPSDALRDSFTNLTDLTKREEISLYPNPASKILTIDLSELSSKEADIYLYDANGRPVFSRQSFREKTLKLDVSAYTNGMYVIQVYSDRQLIRKKVMVRK